MADGASATDAAHCCRGVAERAPAGGADGGPRCNKRGAGVGGVAAHSFSSSSQGAGLGWVGWSATGVGGVGSANDGGAGEGMDQVMAENWRALEAAEQKALGHKRPRLEAPAGW